MSIVLPSYTRITQYYIACATLSSFIIWIIFKQIYPYPFITIDSYYYIGSAYENANAGSWPIGYSKFIRMVGYFSHSSTLLVSIQYWLLQFSFIYFFITIRKTLHLGKWSSFILFIFLFLNPLFIYGSNHIMSDILFCSLTLCWICQLCWILKSPKLYMIIIQAILLTAIFTIRYTAIYFPIFTIIVLIVSRQPTWQKISGILFTLILLTAFIQFTRVEMGKIGGIRQFSSAGGWKQACNALYMYEHIAGADHATIPEKFKVIHQLTQNYFKGPHTHVDLYHIDQEFTTGSFYVAAYESPLMQYLRIKRGENADVFNFKNIAPFGPIFNAYGNYLILHHPFAYLQYVVFPNAVAYLLPFPEIYGAPNDLYYLWSNHLGEMTKSWFGLKSIEIPRDRIETRGSILSPYPTIFTIIHAIFFLSFLIFLLLKYFKKLDQVSRSTVMLITSICIVNCVFTTLTAASVLRFQFTFIILEFVMVLFFIKAIFQNDTSK